MPWLAGSHESRTSRGSERNTSLAAQALAASARCEWTKPRGVPVVPEESNTVHGASGSHAAANPSSAARSRRRSDASGRHAVPERPSQAVLSTLPGAPRGSITIPARESAPRGAPLAITARGSSQSSIRVRSPDTASVCRAACSTPASRQAMSTTIQSGP